MVSASIAPQLLATASSVLKNIVFIFFALTYSARFNYLYYNLLYYLQIQIQTNKKADLHYSCRQIGAAATCTKIDAGDYLSCSYHIFCEVTAAIAPNLLVRTGIS